jgi:hypothetical protein
MWEVPTQHNVTAAQATVISLDRIAKGCQVSFTWQCTWEEKKSLFNTSVSLCAMLTMQKQWETMQLAGEQGSEQNLFFHLLDLMIFNTYTSFYHPTYLQKVQWNFTVNHTLPSCRAVFGWVSCTHSQEQTIYQMSVPSKVSLPMYWAMLWNLP